jgi:GNAT superfamily N-acetyltransferase
MPMVPLDTAAAREVLRQLGPTTGPGLLALRHALEFRPAWLWGDGSSSPRSIVLIREGDDQLEAFGAGAPEPAVGWLTAHQRRFTLHAPETWLAAVVGTVGEVDQDDVEIWSLERAAVEKARAPGRVVTQRLTSSHSRAFRAAAPAWALRGWRSYASLVKHGAVFGAPQAHADEFLALAWIFEQAGPFDAIAVCTAPHYRRLGLARGTVAALIEQIVGHRRRIPLWYVAPGNEPSRALARSLGFEQTSSEPLLRWPPKGAAT